MSDFLRQSPNELLALHEAHTKRARTMRIKQVREQSKILSVSRIRKYQDSTKQEWQTALTHQSSKFQQARADSLVELDVIYENFMNENWGKAHLNALETKDLKTETIDKLRIITSCRHSQEDIHYNQSLKLQRNLKSVTNEPIETKNALRQAIIFLEKARSKLIVEKQNNESKNACVVEIESNNIYRRLGQYALQYDSTCFHREFAVIR
jgi:hypothetical protein